MENIKKNNIDFLPEIFHKENIKEYVKILILFDFHDRGNHYFSIFLEKRIKKNIFKKNKIKVVHYHLVKKDGIKQYDHSYDMNYVNELANSLSLPIYEIV